jgi:hypothetical protein
VTAESNPTSDPREVIDLLRRAQDHADRALPALIASAVAYRIWDLWQGFSAHGKDTAVMLAHELLSLPEREEGTGPLLSTNPSSVSQEGER